MILQQQRVDINQFVSQTSTYTMKHTTI